MLSISAAVVANCASADLAEHSAPARFLKYHYASIDPAYVY